MSLRSTLGGIIPTARNVASAPHGDNVKGCASCRQARHRALDGPGEGKAALSGECPMVERTHLARVKMPS